MKKLSFITPLGVLILLVSVMSSCGRPADKTDAIIYGPIAKTYELPDVPGVKYFVSPNGDPTSDGLAPENPTSIEEAFARVVTGDAIILRGGIYRTGNLTFNQGIVIQPYRDENPVLNGSLVADSWTEVGENLWVTDWEYLFPESPAYWWHRASNERFTPLHRFNNDGVFVDGRYLQSAGSTEEVDEGTYYVDYDNNKIYIGIDPTDRFIEITAFRKALHRTVNPVHGKEADKKGPVIRGITFTQYPDTMVHIGETGLAIDQHGRDIVGTVIENSTFSNCFRIGIFLVGDSLIMRNSKVTNTNTEGLYIVASTDALIERNIFEKNNIENWTGFFPSAVKIFNQSHRAIVRENLVIDHPNSNGVWWDVGNDDGVFVNNRVERVRHSGYFIEISDGGIVAGNVFEDCNQGIFVLNAANVEIYNNTLINSRADFHRNHRGDQLGVFAWHILLGPKVEERDGHVFVNNLFYMSRDYEAAAVQTGQPAFLCERLPEPHLIKFNNNIYVRDIEGGDDKPTLIQWGPYPNEECQISILIPGELNEFIPEFSSDCRYFENYTGPLFIDLKNKNYRLAARFQGIDAAAEIPDHIARLMGLDAGQAPFPGAFAPK